MNPEYYFIYSVSEIQRQIYSENLLNSFSDIQNLTEHILSNFKKNKIDRALEKGKSYVDRLERFNIQVLDYYNPNYPQLLKEIYDPPIVLYYFGNIDLLNSKIVSIIGTRKPSEVTIQGMKLLPNYFYSRNIRVVASGLSPGIEKKIIRTMIQAKFPYIVMLPLGLDLYLSNDDYSILKRNSEGSYLLLSELPPGSTFCRWSYPARNRILTGMSEEIWILEASENSCTVSAVQHALSQNREIYVFTDPKQKNNKGGEKWLEEGANSIYLQDLVPDGYKVIQLDDLLSNHYSKTSGVLAKLSKEEFNGIVQSVGSGYYIKKEK